MEFPKEKQIILFDGVCNYCNDIVNKIIESDNKDLFRFVALQSEKGQEIIKYIGINPNIDSIVLYQPGFAYYVKSEAVFKIARQLNSGFTLIKLLSILPSSLADLGYNYFAKNRYNWYGKKEACMIPTPEIKAKFL